MSQVETPKEGIWPDGGHLPTERPASNWPEVLGAIVRLNSWAKSAGVRDYLYPPVKAIYALKNEALKYAYRYGLTESRLVHATPQCRSCGGSGDYYTEGDCWHCDGTGQAFLRFVETKITDGPRWHTPTHAWPLPIPRGDSIRAEDWEPNQRDGQELPLVELIEALDLAEAFFPPHFSDAPFGGGIDKRFLYRINLGRQEDRCQLCGLAGTATGMVHHVCRGHFEWKAAVCEPCCREVIFGSHWDDRLPLPPVPEHPALLRWLLRREEWRLREERRLARREEIERNTR